MTHRKGGRALLLALLTLAGSPWPRPSAAIEFAPAASTAVWQRQEALAGGCVALDGAERPAARLWVGDCRAEDGMPHGKGFFIDRGALFSAGANAGRLYRKDPPAATDRDIERYRPRALALAAYGAALFAPPENGKGPRQSMLYQQASRFLADFPDAPAAERAAVQAALDRDEARQLAEGLRRATTSETSAGVAAFLDPWGGHLDEATRSRLQARRDALQAQERANAERLAAQRQAEERAREQQREQMRKRACEQFYPGYVGKYRGPGLLATTDTFLVRYVNPAQQRVTIEGRERGNSLEFGQVLELPCFDLWERLR